MRLLRFDLNLWLCCSVIAVPIFCAVDLNEYVNHHLDMGKLRIFLALDTAGGLLVGLVAHVVLAKFGFRMSRRRTDQDDDYDDLPS